MGISSMRVLPLYNIILYSKAKQNSLGWSSFVRWTVLSEALLAAHRLTLPPWIQQPVVVVGWPTNNTGQYFLPCIVGRVVGNTGQYLFAPYLLSWIQVYSSWTKPILLHSGGNDWLWMKEVNLKLCCPKQTRTLSTKITRTSPVQINMWSLLLLEDNATQCNLHLFQII